MPLLLLSRSLVLLRNGRYMHLEPSCVSEYSQRRARVISRLFKFCAVRTDLCPFGYRPTSASLATTVLVRPLLPAHSRLALLDPSMHRNARLLLSTRLVHSLALVVATSRAQRAEALSFCERTGATTRDAMSSRLCASGERLGVCPRETACPTGVPL